MRTLIVNTIYWYLLILSTFIISKLQCIYNRYDGGLLGFLYLRISLVTWALGRIWRSPEFGNNSTAWSLDKTNQRQTTWRLPLRYEKEIKLKSFSISQGTWFLIIWKNTITVSWIFIKKKFTRQLKDYRLWHSLAI